MEDQVLKNGSSRVAGPAAAPTEEPSGEVSQADELTAQGTAVRKTYLEFREEARHSILSSSDREKYEELDPEERDFVDAACLYEFNSQKVSQSKQKVKLREMLLCRDVAQAYCSGRDILGQYSEGKRILKNSESGSETVKFVLGRKVCSMLEKINNLYCQHPRSYVSADVHRAETALLNYTGRLGKIIREPLGEARRIYVRLKERAGWEIPPTAFGNAEGTDVPLLFFNRYSDSNQLLMKDPTKPFRSDNAEPPLKLDFRIKNAVLIMAGENRFYLDRKKFDSVRDSATARAIMLKSLGEARARITEAYQKDTFKLAIGFGPQDDINVRAIKESAFNVFYGYTLKSLPNTAARGDAAELFLLKLMEEENSVGCPGFCRFIFPPEAVSDESNPDYWQPGNTRAFKLRRVFYDIGIGTARLSMFASRMNELLTEYLELQLQAAEKKLAKPFEARLARAGQRLTAFRESNRSSLEETQRSLERLETLRRERSQVAEDTLALVEKMFKTPSGDSSASRSEERLERLGPKLKEECAKREQTLAQLKERYESLGKLAVSLAEQVKKVDALAETIKQNPGDSALIENQRKLLEALASLVTGDHRVDTQESLRGLAVERVRQSQAGLAKIKEQFDQVLEIQKPLRKIASLLKDAERLAGEIGELEKTLEPLLALKSQAQALEAELAGVMAERDECLCRTEEAIEVNRET